MGRVEHRVGRGGVGCVMWGVVIWRCCGAVRQRPAGRAQQGVENGSGQHFQRKIYTTTSLPTPPSTAPPSPPPPSPHHHLPPHTNPHDPIHNMCILSRRLTSEHRANLNLRMPSTRPHPNRI